MRKDTGNTQASDVKYRKRLDEGQEKSQRNEGFEALTRSESEPLATPQ
jgi:hypothetical protein